MGSSSVSLDELDQQASQSANSVSLDELDAQSPAQTHDFTQEALSGKLAPVTGKPQEPQGEERINAKTGLTYRESAVPEAEGWKDPLIHIAAGAEPIATGLSRIKENSAPPVNPQMPMGRSSRGPAVLPQQPPTPEQDARHRQIMLGASEVLQGASQLGTVALPAALATAPIKAAVGIGAGYLASEGAGKIAHKAGASPEAEELTRQVAFFVPSAVGVVSGLKTGTVETPEGKFSGASAFGGKVRAGIARTPDVTSGRVKVGDTQFEVNIPRKPAPIPEPSEAAKTLASFEQHTGNPDFQPAPPPPVPPGTNGPEHLTPDVVKGVSDAIMQAPEGKRPGLMTEAHGNMVKWMVGRGTFTGPDGKIHVVDNEGQAKKLASKFINDEVDRRDAVQEQATKVKEEANNPTITAPIAGKPPAAGNMTTDTAAVAKVAAEANIHPEQKPAIAVKKEPPKETAALAQPPEPVKPEDVAQIGKEDKESGRTILQPSDNVIQNERLAAHAAPELATKLSHIAASVEGATFDRLRPQKELERVDEKVDDAGKPPETVPDYLASQIAADSPQAKDQLVAAIKKHFNVIQVEDNFLEGKPELANYRSVNLQVQMENGSTSEVQIVPREQQEIANQSHVFYTAGREAGLLGDKAEQKNQYAKAAEMHDAAMDKFNQRNGIEAPQPHSVPLDELEGLQTSTLKPDQAMGNEAPVVPQESQTTQNLPSDEVAKQEVAPEPEELIRTDNLPLASRSIVEELQAGRVAGEPDFTNAKWKLQRLSPEAIMRADPTIGKNREPLGYSRTKGPIVIDSRGGIIDGRHRLAEARNRGETEIEAYVQQPERRTNTAERKRVEHLTPEERGHELLTSELTGLPNKRAFAEDAATMAETHPHVGYADIDDFKEFNSILGHEGVDEKVLPEIGEVFRRAIEKEPGGSIKVYHRSGDEFLFRSKDEAAISRVVDRVNKELETAVFTAESPDGKIHTKQGAGLKNGTGRNAKEAEHNAEFGNHPGSKKQRKEAGLRSGARDIPEPVGEKPAAGEQAGGREGSHSVPLEELEKASPTETISEHLAGRRSARIGTLTLPDKTELELSVRPDTSITGAYSLVVSNGKNSQSYRMQYKGGTPLSEVKQHFEEYLNIDTPGHKVTIGAAKQPHEMTLPEFAANQGKPAENRYVQQQHEAVKKKAATPERKKRTLLAADKFSDFDTAKDKVIREGDRTFIVDRGGQYKRQEVESDVMQPQFIDNAKKLTPERREKMIAAVKDTPYLSDEGKKERLAVLHGGATKEAPQPGSPEYESLRKNLEALSPRKPVETPGRALAVRYGQKVADRLRTVADGLDKQIEDKQRSMTSNPTPKRMREYRSRLHDGENLKRVQQAMRALADAHEQGNVPKGLENLRTKDEIYRLVYKGVEGGGGYYDVIPSQDYANKTPQGKALQELMERHKNEPSEAKAEREKAFKISQLEADVQFQKLPGYLPTPKPVVEKMLDAADIQPGDKVLEPSAGKGNIADLIKEREPEAKLSAIEPQSKLRQILELKGHELADSDFLGHKGEYDKIVMNPPFENGQDIDHVQHAFTLLKPGGKLVAIMSESPFFRNDRKGQEFRDWLEEHGGTSKKLEPGSFKESGTGVNARMVEIEKAKAAAAVESKEPWQMTQGYVSLERAKSDFPIAGKVEVRNDKPVYTYSTTTRWDDGKRDFSVETRGPLNGAEQARRLHKKVIEAAIAEGKPVPAEVLKDYPDLKNQAIAQFDEAVKHTGAEVKEGKPSEAFAGKIEEATRLEPANDAELKEKFTGAAYQREYFKAALGEAKAAWIAGKESKVPGEGGAIWEFLAKDSGYAKEPDRPADYKNDQLYIKVPGDGHFLVNNTPFAIEKALKGATRGFAAPRASLSPEAKIKKFSAPKAAPADYDKYARGLQSELGDLISEKEGIERNIQEHPERVAELAKLKDDLAKELKAIESSDKTNTDKRSNSQAIREKYNWQIDHLQRSVDKFSLKEEKAALDRLEPEIEFAKQNVDDFAAFRQDKADKSSPAITDPTRIVPGGKSAFTGNETGLDELQQLTNSIAQSAKGKSLSDRIKTGVRLGQEQSPGGGLSELIGRIKGGTAALIDAYKRPPKWSDYEDATGKWSAADQRSALDLWRFGKEIKKAVPDKLAREAMSNWIEAAGDNDVLKERADKSDAKFKPGYERALKLSDAEKTIAQNIMNLHDATLQEAVKAGILQAGVENYIQHIYKDKPAMVNRVRAEMNFSSLKTKPSFSKQRTLPTYFDAEQLGFTPKDKDVGYLTAVHERSLREALAARSYIKALTDGEAPDGRPLVVTSWASAKEIAREDEEGNTIDPAYLIRPNMKPDGDYGDYRVIDHPSLRGWKWAGEVEGKPVFVQGDVLVHPSIYRKLKNNLTQSAIRSYEVEVGGKTFRPGRAFLTAQTELKHAVLSFSGFHQTALGVHALEHKTNPGISQDMVNAVVRRTVDPDFTMPGTLPDIDLNQPEQAKLVDHGLMVANYDAEEAFGEGLASGGLVTKIPVIGPGYHVYTDYLFKDYMPRLKMQMALNALERNQKRYEGRLTEDQIYAITAKQGNAAFGGLNYRMLGRSKTLQDTWRLLLMAPDFTEARGRFVAQAARPWGKEQLMALMLGAGVMYIAARVLNQMFDDDPHWDKPFSVVYDHKEYELRTVQGDMLRAATDPRRFAQNRLSPLVSAVFKSDDRYHKKHESLADKLKQHADGVVPIPLQPWVRESKDSNAQKAMETALKMVGINVKNEPKKHK